MGVAGLDAVRDAAAARTGARRGTPFALIENGSRPEQRVVTGTLAELAGTRARTTRVQSPALLIAGRSRGAGERPALVRRGAAGSATAFATFRQPLRAYTPAGRLTPLPGDPHGHLRQHPRHHRPHPDRQAAPHRAGARHAVRQGRILQSRRLGQGSPGAGDRPRCRAKRRCCKPGQTRSSKRPRAIPASRWRWSRPRAATRSSR